MKMKSSLLAAPLILLIPGTVCGDERLWQEHINEASILFDSGRYKEARAVYELSVKDEETPSDSGLRKAVSWANVALASR
jgi:hypothetical protein